MHLLFISFQCHVNRGNGLLKLSDVRSHNCQEGTSFVAPATVLTVLFKIEIGNSW
jgi:hypothetical protein